ncbi:PAAR domain-containing protein [Kosakonia sp.]|uniref:PAAR domain-containing protein n=1 Tax=Kosakonia sp. TaxID=1916651 RepID=UPI0028AB4397|nr:PAAR domain-containing protein [Kosakonia sp.]
MGEYQAARVDDPIAHTASQGWMIAGLIGGALLGVAAVAVTGGAALVAVSAVAASACAGGGLGEVLGSMSWAPRHVTGMLKEGSPDVFVNSRKAIRAHLSLGECDEHSGSPQRVAEGSIKVYINNYPAARISDRLTCSAEIYQGSANVFIGGAKVQTDEISPEIPEWVNWVMLGVGVGALAVIAGPVIALLSTAGGMAGGTLGNYVGGKIFGEGSDGQKWSMLAGGLIGGGLGAKGGAKFNAWRAGKIVAEPVAVKPVATAKPLMSLKEAVGEAKASKWIARGRELIDNKAPHLSKLLTDDQVGALHGYTTDPGYKMINPALRGTKPLTPELEAFAQHINEGLDNLPAHTGTTFRGMNSLPDEVLSQYTPGNTVSDRAFVSSDINKAFDGPIQMKMEGYSGRKIDFLSEFNATETEVLFKSNTQFEVISRTDEAGITQIHMKEL